MYRKNVDVVLQRWPQLGPAFAINSFVTSLLEAMNGAEAIIETCYVKSYQTTSDFISLPVLLGVATP